MTDNPIDTSPSAVVVLTKQLHSPQLNDDMMRRWDALREEIANGNRGSHPRDIFESIIDSIDEERSEAAYFLEELSAKLGEAEKERDEVLAKVKELNQQNTSLRRSLRTKLLSMIYATEGHAMNDEPKVDTSDEACAVACTLVSNPQGALRKDGDGWQKRVNDLIRALRDERHKLATETIMTRVAVDALKAERDSALAQLAEARRENERLDRCLAFFASVIKSGEPWTETCEREYAAARSSLPQH